MSDAEEFFEKHKGLALTIAKLFYRKDSFIDFQDCVQSAFLGLLQARKAFKEGEAAFSTFASYRIRGEIYDEVRRHKGRDMRFGGMKRCSLDKEQNEEEENPLTIGDSLVSEQDVMLEVDLTQLSELLKEIIDSLPKHLKDCILLYYWGDLSCKETGKALDLTEGTVQTYLYDARKLIRKRLIMKTKKSPVVLKEELLSK